MLQLAPNREPPLASNLQSDETFRKIMGGGWFLQFFEPLYLKNQQRFFFKKEYLVDVKSQDVKNGFATCFRYL